MRIGVVGNGVVGQQLVQLFGPVTESVSIYDKHSDQYGGVHNQHLINSADLVFLAVPTPCDPLGRCDLSAIEEAVSWIDKPICIKSTVVPGTTDRLVRETGKLIVFSPEYIGETPFHSSRQDRLPDLVAVGGERSICLMVASLYKLAVGPVPRYFITTAVNAEFAKYMENCFLAMKVAFVSQFSLISDLVDADFDQCREMWLADSRIGRSHSAIIGGLGFGGRCLPKDLAAIVAHVKELDGSAPLLEALQTFNQNLRTETSCRNQ